MAITFPSSPIIIPSNTQTMQLHAELYPSIYTYGPNPDFTNKEYTPLVNDVLKAWNDVGIEYQDSCKTTAKVPGDVYATPYSYTNLQIWNPNNSAWEDLGVEINKWDSTKGQLQTDPNPYDPNTETEQYNSYYAYGGYGYYYYPYGYGLKNFKRFDSKEISFDYLTSFKNFTDAEGDSTLDSYWNEAQSLTYLNHKLVQDFPEHFPRNTLSSCDTSLSVFLRFKTTFNNLEPATLTAKSTAYSSYFSDEFGVGGGYYCYDGDSVPVEFRQSAISTEVVGFRAQIGGCLYSARVYSAFFDTPKEQVGDASLNMWPFSGFAPYGFY